MWSHYADYHKGICIEYDKKEVSELCEPDICLLKVRYSDEACKVNVFDKNADLELQKLCTTKSKCWSYEKEWRLIAHRDDKENGFNFKFVKPSAIYLGTKVSEIDKEFVKKFCMNKKISMFQMTQDKNSFNISPKLVFDYSNIVFKILNMKKL